MSHIEIVRMPPHSVEAEEAVLGSALIDLEAILRISPRLRADDVFIVENGWVWLRWPNSVIAAPSSSATLRAKTHVGRPVRKRFARG